jgi:mannose-6-phosphate isomerase-like protein (cupin superfamily)
MRRVVTGHTPDGKAIVASDTEVSGGTSPFLQLRGADGTPTFPDDGSPQHVRTFSPPVGGFRFVAMTVPPQSVKLPRDLDVQAVRRAIAEEAPDLVTYMEKDHPGFHTTPTIDSEYVISGEVWLALDDGKEVHLRAGDTVVQNGTRHAWHNRGSEPCRVVGCLIGAHRK